MRKLSNVPKIINCTLFSWSVSAFIISGHKYHKSIQSHLAHRKRNMQGGFQWCLNEQVQTESLFWKSPPCHQSFRRKATETMFSVLGDTEHMISFCTDAGCTVWIYLFNPTHTYT